MPHGFLKVVGQKPTVRPSKPFRPALTGQVTPATEHAIGNLFERLRALEVSHAQLQANALTKADAERKYSPAVIREALQATGSHPMKAYSLLGVPFHGYTGQLTATSNANVWLLPSAPNPAESLILFVGGVLQVKDTNFTVTGPKVTFTAPPGTTPGPGWWRS
jgi:hypothetical protein